LQLGYTLLESQIQSNIVRQCNRPNDHSNKINYF